jgi:hypothetical protein
VLRIEPKVEPHPQAGRRSSWWFTDMAEVEYSDTSAALRSDGEVLFDLPGNPEAESEMDWHPLDRPGFDAWWQLLCARTNVLSMLDAVPTTMPSTQPQAR